MQPTAIPASAPPGPVAPAPPRSPQADGNVALLRQLLAGAASGLPEIDRLLDGRVPVDAVAPARRRASLQALGVWCQLLSVAREWESASCPP